MPQLSLSHEALDASNRALGLLAGATSQSFSQIGYGHAASAVNSNSGPGVEGAGTLLNSIFSNTAGAAAPSSDGLLALLKTLQDEGAPLPLEAFGADFSTLTDLSAVNYSDSAQAEMDDQLQWAAAAQNTANLDDSSAVLNAQSESPAPVESSNSFVSDLLSDLLARLSDNDAITTELSGEKQAAFRDFLESLGGGLDGNARDFLQSNIQGQVKAVSNEVIDATGVDALDPVLGPVQNFDYYGTSADLVQDTRSALSLSSIALPQIGPTVAWVREDLIQSFNS